MHAQILKYFNMVAELGSIREAAQRLHVSASAINRQILNLEELIGERLFERRRTGMVLTEAGESVSWSLQKHSPGFCTDAGRN